MGGKPDPAELVIEEADVEGRVMDDEAGAVREPRRSPRRCAEKRLVRQKGAGQAVDFGRGFRHVALGIEVPMPVSAGRDVVDQLDAGQLDDAVVVLGVEPGRLGVENKFAH